MFKVIVLIAFAVVGAQAQVVTLAPGAEAAPEPYSYGYETDTHAAAEQRDPAGSVTGFYTLADADGRQRRVDYVADAAGFRAKVATNEVGTKSENPADVEILASPPTEAQLVYQAAPQVAARQQVVYQAPRVAATAVTAAPAVVTSAPAVSRTSYSVIGQPAATGSYSAQYGSYYQPGFAYGNNYAYGPAGYGYGYGNPGYGAAGFGNAGFGNAGYGNAGYGSSSYYSSYNNHLPSQYYRSIATTGAPAAAGVRYVQSVAQPAATLATGNYRAFGIAPATSSLAYSAGTRTIGGPIGGNPLGSSNYIVLKKRAAAAK